MIPSKFQSFILPQHKRVVFGAPFVKREGTSLLYDTKQQAYTGKKRGPKKHGPVARMLKQRLNDNYRRIPDEVRPAWDRVCKMFYEEFELAVAGSSLPVYMGETEAHYYTILCMAYAIALDEGV